MKTASRALLLAAAGLVCLNAQQQRTFPQPPPPHEVTITAIPGVVDAGAKWAIAFQSAENSDGITAAPDGGLLFAQEQSSRINKIDAKDQFSMYLSNGHGVGGVAIGPKKKVYAVERTCTDPGQKPDQCKENTAISTLTPMRKVLADSYMGKNLGRINDLVVAKIGRAHV